MDKQELKKQLQKQGVKIWSYSRLSSYHECQYGYWLKYVKGIKDKGNCYSFSGTEIHQLMEDVYDGVKSESNVYESVLDLFVDLEMFDINFPSPSIEDKWKKDIEHWGKNFKKRNGTFKTEEMILFEVSPGIWLQGFIDLQEIMENGVNIYDFKTSSMFAKSDMIDKGRQLTLYKMALENDGLVVPKVGFEMLKYITINTTLKNGKPKQYVKNRSSWVKDIQNDLQKNFKSAGYDDFTIQAYIDEAIEKNSIDNLPEDIKSKYSVEPNILWYDADESIKEEAKKWVIDTAMEIESKKEENEDDWEGKYLTGEGDFFCSMLCGVRKECKYYKEWLDNKDRF